MDSEKRVFKYSICKNLNRLRQVRNSKSLGAYVQPYIITIIVGVMLCDKSRV
jgi:hypothetical protein